MSVEKCQVSQSWALQKACRTGVKSVQHVDEEDKDPLFFLGVVVSDAQNTDNLAPDIDDVENEPPWHEVIYVKDYR